MEPNQQPPADKKSWKDGKSPLNVRPRGAQIDFVDTLIKEKGSAQAALSHCLDLAMGNAGGPDLTRYTDEIRTLKSELSTAKSELTAVKKNPAPVSIEYKQKEQLAKIMKSKKLNETEAVDWALSYSKNAWI